ncbi:MAG TPA: hypothetical protein VNC78_11445 [Actinomycetota bacterium]|nr:hypothetical protein [Actinomycetota bacterium]
MGVCVRLLAVTVAVVLMAGPAVSAPSAGGLASSNVEYVASYPFDAGGAQLARVVDGYLYLAGWRGFSIYDIGDPMFPKLVSTLPQGFSFPNESLDTDGEILLLQEQTPQGILRVYDVGDKAAPALVGELPGVNDHTIECVLHCTWAYGSSGAIVDLRDPTAPVLAGDWSGGALTFGHTVNEVAPGIVLTTALPHLQVLDARGDPTRPRELALTPAPSDLVQGVSAWPRLARDSFILSAEESSFTGRCDEQSSVFRTYDATNWKKTHTFKAIDELRLTNGTIVDGRPPAGVLGCSTHIFEEQPDFYDGGIVALAHYEHGTRFLEVDGRGDIAEVGWFLPWGGQTSAVAWVTDDIVYAIDVARGIDILRFNG